MDAEAGLGQAARDINTLAGFLGMRDVPALTRDALAARYGFERADVMALFGGSILAGGDVLADAMRSGVARTYVIVGGAGHTTETFRSRARALCPGLAFGDDATEAQIFSSYVSRVHGLGVDLLETRSTNCGNNITYLRDLLAERGDCLQEPHPLAGCHDAATHGCRGRAGDAWRAAHSVCDLCGARCRTWGRAFARRRARL
ncbi:MAG: hypothetical protein MR874_04485 [Coriobacteriaceae bacterium]|uniref:hypothetical protein n=1 Tax=Tractidigestivibacter sp. TaxID=2847320 RepID=UPI002A80D5F6|nr:hypothetical protein [Tractidigestivibacter sp.]MCI6844001.1 hypothetical protein [Coriobacteriaceae bacterium]MDD7584706.1 hypothetical protein [Coriobacteriaceae bacterium]MDY4534752.1 hypothetical protein [Tractidigestivibacter sp.]